ncbi:MAG: Fic family protein [Deltaproteobacteria bacterium]|nr:Fic family protein [Deltaproteobacteria bacterium]
MKRELQGTYLPIATSEEKFQSFIPAPLPPIPPINWTSELLDKFNQAHLAVGRLDSVSSLLPDVSLFLYTYIRKEAVFSSMIENIKSSLSDLLLYELEQKPGLPMGDVQEVSDYVAAINHGLSLLERGLPLSLRLLREIHGVLLSHGRGSHKTPGEFRRSQNWIGGSKPGDAAFVPPPANMVIELMGQLELFLHDQPVKTPGLLKAALAHVQFETIHPFLDGNGRLGRLLITLILCEQKLLSKPMLYLSYYFKTHRNYYYHLLNEVRRTGDWEAWLDFFAEAVTVSANQATETAQKLFDLAKLDRQKITSAKRRSAATQLKLHQIFLERPIVTSAWLSNETKISPATINKSLELLEELGVIRRLTSKKRNRVFSYSQYIEIMNAGAEPPPDQDIV